VPSAFDVRILGFDTFLERLIPLDFHSFGCQFVIMLRVTWILAFLLVGSHSQASIKNVVLLGDSYSSGNGARDSSGQPNYDLLSGGACLRSPTTWGAQVASFLGASFVNNACSGSVIANIKSRLTAVTSQTDLVLLTIGGNDFGFGNIVTKCFVSLLRVATDCQNAINFAVTYIPTLEANLTTALLTLNPLLNATDSKVILVAYPHITLDVPFVYTDFIGGGSVEITNQIRSLAIAVEAGQRRAVKAANTAAGKNFVLFYNQTKALFDKHEPHPSVFEKNSIGWIWELDSAPWEFYHLNPFGHGMLGRAVVNVFLPNVSLPVPAPISAPLPVSVPVPIAAPVPAAVAAPVPVAVPVPIAVPVPVANPNPIPVVAPVRIPAGSGCRSILSRLFRASFRWFT
jgi:lysophospholipase L1-like esterase